GDDVLPHLSIRKLPLRWDRTIGIDVVAAMDEEIGPTVQHGRIGAHPAAGFVDPPAATSGVARPHEGDAALFPRRGAEAPDLRLAPDRERKILEPDAIEYVLPRGQPLDQRLGGEIGLRQGVDQDGAADILETVAGRNLDQHARWPVGAPPDDTRVDRNVARLDAVGDERAIGCAAELRPGEAGGGDARRRDRSRQEPAPRERRGAAARDDGHWASAVESTRRKLPASSDRGSTFSRRPCESSKCHWIALAGAETRAADIAMSFKSHRFVLFDHR